MPAKMSPTDKRRFTGLPFSSTEQGGSRGIPLRYRSSKRGSGSAPRPLYQRCDRSGDRFPQDRGQSPSIPLDMADRTRRRSSGDGPLPIYEDVAPIPKTPAHRSATKGGLPRSSLHEPQTSHCPLNRDDSKHFCSDRFGFCSNLRTNCTPRDCRPHATHDATCSYSKFCNWGWQVQIRPSRLAPSFKPLRQIPPQGLRALGAFPGQPACTAAGDPPAAPSAAATGTGGRSRLAACGWATRTPARRTSSAGMFVQSGDRARRHRLSRPFERERSALPSLSPRCRLLHFTQYAEQNYSKR